MDIYSGDGDVVKMHCQKTGEILNPNMHEWVLRRDADKLEKALRLAKEMMLCNDLDLPKTMEVINEALDGA